MIVGAMLGIGLVLYTAVLVGVGGLVYRWHARRSHATRVVACPYCRGRGRVPMTSGNKPELPCSLCGGAGKLGLFSESRGGLTLHRRWSNGGIKQE